MGKTFCKSCGAEIYWVTMRATGKMMPVDAGPAVTVCIAAVNNEDGVLYSGRTPHWITCPNADSHRKPRKGS